MVAIRDPENIDEPFIIPACWLPHSLTRYCFLSGGCLRDVDDRQHLGEFLARGDAGDDFNNVGADLKRYFRCEDAVEIGSCECVVDGDCSVGSGAALDRDGWLLVMVSADTGSTT